MAREKIELRAEREAQPVERPTGGKRESSEGSFELASRLGQDGLKEAALRVVVVEQQLLVDAGTARDLVHARPSEPAIGVLISSRGDDP
jgi:hypothetical protein